MKIFYKGAVIALVAAVGAYALLGGIKSRIDIDEYRTLIKTEVRSRLGLDVEIDELDYTLFGRLKITARGVSAHGDSVHLTAEKVVICLPLIPLAMGQPTVTDVTVISPVANAERREDGSWNLSEPMGLLLASQGGGGYRNPVKRLSVVGGKVFVTDRFIDPGHPRHFLFSLSNITYNSSGIMAPMQIKVSGTVMGEGAGIPVQANFTLRQGKDLGFWEGLQVGGNVRIEDIPPALYTLYGGDFLQNNRDGRERLSLSLQFEGEPLEKLSFQSTAELGVSGGRDRKTLVLTGSLKGDSIQLDRVLVDTPVVSFSGSARLQDIWDEDPLVSLSFNSPYLDVKRILNVLPEPITTEPIVGFIKSMVMDGSVRFKGLSLRARMKKLLNPMGISGGDIALSGQVDFAGFHLEGEALKRPITGLGGTATLYDNRLEFHNVKASLGNTTLKEVTGVIRDFWGKPVIAAQVGADLDLKEFHEELTGKITAPELSRIFKAVRDISGNIDFDFRFAFDVAALKFNEFRGTFDFSGVGFRHSLFDFPVRQLNGAATVDESTIDIKDVTWLSGSTRFESRGKITDYTSQEYSLDLEFSAEGDVSELAHTSFYSFPQLKDMQGQIASKLEINGTLNDLTFVHWADLSQTEYGFKNIIYKPRGVFSQEVVSGTINRRGDVDIKFLELKLGHSIIRAEGRVKGIPEVTGYDLTVEFVPFNLNDFPDFFLDYMPDESKGSITGRMHLKNLGGDSRYSYNFKADIDRLKLGPLADLGPVLGYINPRGIIDGRFTIAGGTGKLLDINGYVNGSGVGFKTMLKEPFSGFEGRVEFTGDRIVAEKIKGRMGKSRAEVDFYVDIKDVPRMELNVRGEEVHLRDIVSLGQDDEAGEEDQIEDMANNVFQGRWRVKVASAKGTLNDIRYKDLTTDFVFENDFFTFDHLRFGGYEGKWDFTGTLDITDHTKEKFEADVKVEDFDLVPFLRDVIPQMRKLTGRMSFQGHVTGDGFSWDKFSKSLDGKLDYRVEKGRVKQFDGLSQLFSYLNIVPLWEEKEEEQKGGGLPFESIKGLFDFKDGEGYTDNTMLEGNVVRVSAVGYVDLGREQLDMTLGVKPFTSIDSLLSSIPLAGKVLTGDEKSLIVHYYEVGGTFSKPTATGQPMESVTRGLIGIFQRLLEAPARALSDPEMLEKQEKRRRPRRQDGRKKNETTP